MKFYIKPTQWKETYRLYDDDKFLGQGDYPFCLQLKERYEYCEGRSNCADCGHRFMDHLMPSTLKLRVYEPATQGTRFKAGTYTYYACDHSEGCMDMGCDCKGYRLPGYSTIMTDIEAMANKLGGEVKVVPNVTLNELNNLRLALNEHFEKYNQLVQEVYELKDEVARIKSASIPPRGIIHYDS